LASRKQSEATFPFADVCILYEIFPKRLAANGKIGSRSFWPGQLKRKALYIHTFKHILHVELYTYMNTCTYIFACTDSYTHLYQAYLGPVQSARQIHAPWPQWPCAPHEGHASSPSSPSLQEICHAHQGESLCQTQGRHGYLHACYTHREHLQA
jgi:hypothetical protein